jgi:hypothetical protein
MVSVVLVPNRYCGTGFLFEKRVLKRYFASMALEQVFATIKLEIRPFNSKLPVSL